MIFFKFRQTLLFFTVIILLTSCSKRAVEKKISEPVQLYPISIGVGFGIIPEDIIQKAETKYGSLVRNRYEAYNEKIVQLKDSSTQLKLKEINDFFNSVTYTEDIDVWNKKDYWATPLEFLGEDRGDCEDYVIAKYFALRHLGIENEHLFFTYVKSTRLQRPHMVLSYFKTPSSIPLVLDSLNFKIFPADQREDLIPIYNFNGESLYLARRLGQHGKEVQNHDKLHERWDKLISDLKRNKL